MSLIANAKITKQEEGPWLVLGPARDVTRRAIGVDLLIFSVHGALTMLR